MMETLELVVVRKWKKESYTIGQLFIDGKYFCDTLEPKVRNYAGGEKKVKGESAIPEGRYLVKQRFSAKRHKFVPQLEEVPMFEAIQIHVGNTKADTQGCILVGENKKKGFLLHSTDTFDRLCEELIKAWSVHVDVYVTVLN